MKQLFYTFRYLTKTKGSSFIKITSLSLGLLVGIVLFARVAFEMNFDRFYTENDRLFVIRCLYTIGGDAWEPMDIVHAPMPGAFNNEIPEVKYATVTTRPWEKVFKYGEKRFSPVTLYADSLFFKTMGIQVLQGDDRLLGVNLNAFISQTMAKDMFAGEDPIGKVLTDENNQHYTIQGIFEDIPENSHLRFDMVGAFLPRTTPDSWVSQDSFKGYVRIVDHADPETVTEKMASVIRQHRDEDALRARGVSADYYLFPVNKIHSGDDSVKRMCLILSLLALAILIIASMNYILNSISSLSNRAKSVGIHKCNGASSGNIFRMFLYETGILISISLLFVLLLLLAFRGFIEDITNTSFTGLFSSANLWIPLVIIGLIFLLSGYAPARLLSSIPVTQVFRAVTVNKRYWKRVLLFIQFSGVSFILVLLTIVLLQYRMIMNKELGYDSDGILYTSLNIQADNDEEWTARMETCLQEFRRIPYVTEAATHSSHLTSGYGGMPISDEDGNTLFTARWVRYDFNYIPTMQMEFVAGANYTAPGQIIVNETFVKMMGWTEDPVGKVVLQTPTHPYGTIVGVLKDFPITSLYTEQAPILAVGAKYVWGYMTLRIAGFESGKLTQLNEKLAEMFPDQIREFTVLENNLHNQYRSTRQFRDSIVAAFIIVMLITAMGLVGYISDEIIRRSKEIAIRKVNGATAEDILLLLNKDISYLAIPAIICGIGMARWMGGKWLEDFAVKIPLTFSLFLMCGLIVLAIILILVTLRSWMVANENPVKSIKAE
ncbi:MAG: multidrug ABC transporter substrate-binding protein [Tannerellaceae bacterium]|nr:multidrug ABC transporter substrate-binding protein [Tannerellaceae bacterium]